MGTRGAYGFRVGGKDKVTYNHFDSYPTGLGVKIIDYLRDHSPEELRAVADRLTLVDEGSPAPPELVERYKGYADGRVSSGKSTEWYVLLRETQGEPEVWHADPPVEHMIDSHEFLGDSLFCEWAYIVNLDDGFLEVYKGFINGPAGCGTGFGPGRYIGTLSADGRAQVAPRNLVRWSQSSRWYYGVALLDIVPLEQVKTMTDGDRDAILSKWEGHDEVEDGEVDEQVQ